MEAGEILLKRGLLDERKLQLSRDSQRSGNSVLDSAIELGFVSEEKALQAVGDEVGLDYVDLSQAEVDTTLLTDFPQKIIYRDSLFPRCIPLARVNWGFLAQKDGCQLSLH